MRPTLRQTRRRCFGAAAICALVASCGLAATAHAAASHSWISGTGDDANGCSRTAPCKTIAGALSKTDRGGIISAIDAGGYGSVTITKAITIDLSGTNGSMILGSGYPGVTVNAPGEDVTLRGIAIYGAGTCGSSSAGLYGIRLVSARSLHVQDVAIGTTKTALDLTPVAGATVDLDNVAVNNTCSTGVDAASSVGQLNVGIRNSSITNGGTGVLAEFNSHVWLAGTSIFGNALGLQTTGGGIIDAYTDSHVFGNGVDGAPTHVLGAPPPDSDVFPPAAPAQPAVVTNSSPPAVVPGPPSQLTPKRTTVKKCVARHGKKHKKKVACTKKKAKKHKKHR